MPPILTYFLLGICAVVFATSFWIDGRPDGHRLAFLRKFTLIVQIAAIVSAYLILRPGKGVNPEHAIATARAANKPVLLDMYSNW